MRVTEHNLRSIVKAVTFRLIIIVSDIAVIYFVTRRWDITISVMVISNISSTILFYLHERAWNRISWGRAAAFH
jgi:uncharacterized membrane protein